MKKNTMMRIASFLLIAVLLSTSAISGTYAKYVTEGKGEDSARVAKFGVTISHDNNIFYDAYKNISMPYTVNETGDQITVQADTEGTDVVAPGTKGTMSEFTVIGQPEVDVYVSYTPVLTLTGWMIDANKDSSDGNEEEYCPIVITVNGEDFFINGTTINSVAELKSAVEAAIVNKAATYDTNTNLSTVVSDDLSVSWRWAFDDNDTANYVAADNQNDPYDTMLGDNAAADNAATIKLEVTCKITQVD